MAYKDPDKQREASRQASKKYRDSMTGKGMTVADERSNEPSNVIPKTDIRVIPKAEILKRKTLAEITNAEHDEAIEKACCSKGVIGGDDALPKRGKDIKVFADLPPHVQQTIDMMSMVDGKLDKTIKANRTAIAINYQHLFPDRFHSTGIAI